MKILYFLTNVTDKNPATSKLEKAKAKRQSAARKTISFLNDDDDNIMMNNLPDSGKN